MKRGILIACGLLAATFVSPASAQDSGVKGVNPKENIRKAEMLCKYDDFEFGQEVASCTAKYDTALDANWGANIEVPMVSFSGFGLDAKGFGDVNLRLRYTTSAGNLSYIMGAELVLPTATDDVLGRGKYQTNLVGGVVIPLSPQIFVFAGYKHFYSVAGDNDFADINESQPRILAAYTSADGWWVLGDIKYTKSWEGLEHETLDVEGEFGKMIGPATGIFLHGGTSFLDSTREWGINVGLRQIF